MITVKTLENVYPNHYYHKVYSDMKYIVLRNSLFEVEEEELNFGGEHEEIGCKAKKVEVVRKGNKKFVSDKSSFFIKKEYLKKV